MLKSQFFEFIEKHYDQQLPFVCYAQHQELKAYLQTNAELNLISDFKTPGFVFCPFSSTHPQVIFPEDKSKIITSHLQPKKFTAQSTSFSDSTIDKQNHIHLVSNAVKTIENTDLQKVVCSRKIKVEKQVKPLEVFKKLGSKYPEAFCYIWFHPKIGLWLGATPERFLNLERQILKTVALAGTINAKKQPELRWTNKEVEEQQMVVDFIISALKNHSKAVNIGAVQNVKAGNLWHLKTDIKAQIQPEHLSKIIQDLHPTSAVCGLPKDKAKAFIQDHEKYQRSYYSGFFGPMHFKQAVNRSKTRRNQEQQAIQSIKRISDLYVNLRCMQVFENYVELYVGGGITKDSEPEAEYLETLAKSQTLLNVL